MKPTITDAISILKPNVSFSVDSGKITAWDICEVKTGESQPTQEEIDDEIERLQAEYDAQEYARNRQAEYPTIAELTVALYDTDDKSAIEAKRAEVKAKYPKPE